MRQNRQRTDQIAIGEASVFGNPASQSSMKIRSGIPHQESRLVIECQQRELHDEYGEQQISKKVPSRSRHLLSRLAGVEVCDFLLVYLVDHKPPPRSVFIE